MVYRLTQWWGHDWWKIGGGGNNWGQRGSHRWVCVDLGMRSGGTRNPKVQKLWNLIPSSKITKSVNVWLCIRTNVCIVGQALHPSSSLHMGRDADNVAKPTISRLSTYPHRDNWGNGRPGRQLMKCTRRMRLAWQNEKSMTKFWCGKGKIL